MRSFNSFQPFPERGHPLCRGFLLELFSLRDLSLGDFPELRLSHRRHHRSSHRFGHRSSHRLRLTRWEIILGHRFSQPLERENVCSSVGHFLLGNDVALFSLERVDEPGMEIEYLSLAIRL